MTTIWSPSRVSSLQIPFIFLLLKISKSTISEISEFKRSFLPLVSPRPRLSMKFLAVVALLFALVAVAQCRTCECTDYVDGYDHLTTKWCGTHNPCYAKYANPGLKSLGFAQISTPRVGAVAVWQPGSYKTSPVSGGSATVSAGNPTGHVSRVTAVDATHRIFSSTGANQGCSGSHTSWWTACTTDKTTGCTNVNTQMRILYPQSGITFWWKSGVSHLAGNSTVDASSSSSSSSTDSWLVPVLVTLCAVLAVALVLLVVFIVIRLRRNQAVATSNTYKSLIVS